MIDRDVLYLTNILDCVERIRSYTTDGRDAFLSTLIIQDAVIRNFEIIGEAAKRLSPELRARTPEVPRSSITRFRDFFAHQYLRIQLNEVWEAIENELPALEPRIRRLLSE